MEDTRLKYSHDQRSLKELAQEALDVQNASNLSGVVHAFSRAISRLRELRPNEGTEYFNRHPICVLWADKIAHLTGQWKHERVTDGYSVVKKLTEIDF